MSYITLARAKEFLKVDHDEDDNEITNAIASAEQEAEDFMQRDVAGAAAASSEVITPAIELGTLLLVQANYDATVDEIPKLRMAAERKLFPYRCGLGI